MAKKKGEAKSIVSKASAAEQIRANAARKLAATNRAAELLRRDSLKKAQKEAEKGTQPPLVCSV
jgi:hypothetical protein